MTDGPMHPDELAIDEALVRSLLRSQHAAWADLPLEGIRSSGTDNALFRLGDELVVRLPRIPGAAAPIADEHMWLPRLAPRLPLEIPEPVALGEPDDGYPWRWSVYRWIDGDAMTPDGSADPHGLAETLAGFVSALRAVDATGGPRPGDHNGWRGAPLADRDPEFREALEGCRGLEGIVVDEIVSVWEAALGEPDRHGSSVWFHGDLLPTNLLARRGVLSAVIDFGCFGVGDPTCDALPAWTLLPTEARARYREALAFDDATWTRGRAWSLSWAVIALPYYVVTNPTLAAIARRTIGAVLNDPER